MRLTRCRCRIHFVAVTATTVTRYATGYVSSYAGDDPLKSSAEKS